MHHIRDCLPDIKSRINSMMIDVQRELEALGRAPLPTQPQEAYLHDIPDTCGNRSDEGWLAVCAGDPTDALSRATLGGTMLGLLSRFANNFQRYTPAPQ
jgi:hypothetical protein